MLAAYPPLSSDCRLAFFLEMTDIFSPTDPDGRMESTASGDVACVVWVFDAQHYLKDSSSFSCDGFYIGGLMNKEQYRQFVTEIQKEVGQAWQALFEKRTNPTHRN